MNVTYDAETDTLTLVLRSERAAISEEPRPGVILDFDPDDRLVAIEILDASRSVQDVDTIRLKVTPKAAVPAAAE